MKKVKIATEKLWARNKYDVMAKGYEWYSVIKSMFKEAEQVSDYYDIFQKISSIRELPYTKSALINSLEHIWGYFKRVATKAEKDHFFSQLEKIKKIENDLFWEQPEEMTVAVMYVTKLLDKYPQKYLLNSTILFPQLTWNEVTIKKHIILINHDFFLP